ncbi:hypothetical protein Tco_1161373, partial [Tanacetum coccineum]
ALRAYDLGVATPRALVYAGVMTSGDARSWYMISRDAKSAPLTDEEFEVSEPSDTETSHSSALSDLIAPLSPDHPLTQASPTVGSHVWPYRSSYETPSPSSSPTLPIRKRYRGTSEYILDTETEDESSDLDAEREGHGLDDEGHGLEDEGHGLDDEGYGLEDEGSGPKKATPEAQQQAVLVVDTVVS